jgi:hypothetical protein
MLEDRGAGATEATLEATTRAHEIARDTLEGLPEGSENDPDVSDFAYRVRDIQSLTVSSDWTPNQLSDAGTELVDATAALDC